MFFTDTRHTKVSGSGPPHNRGIREILVFAFFLLSAMLVFRAAYTLIRGMGTTDLMAFSAVHSIVLIAGMGGYFILFIGLLIMNFKKTEHYLTKSLHEVKPLKGILPICSSCKKIRDDSGCWNPIEGYIKTHSEVEFSHGICPECMNKLYPEYEKRSG